MKRLLILSVMTLMVFALVVGCGKKADEATDKVPVETKKAEMMDSTRLDEMADSAKQVIEGAVDDAKEAVEDAADSLKAKVPGM